jgi:hypothetical protein
MLASPVFSFPGAGGGKDLPHDEIFSGELMGRLRLLLIEGGEGLMIRRRFRLADFQLDVAPWLG